MRRVSASACAALCLTLGVLVVYAPALRFDATSVDDDALVFRNPVQRNFGWPEVRDALDPRVSRLAYGAQYTPLADLSYALDGRVFGRTPGPYHLQSLVLHGAAVALLIGLARGLGAGPVAAAGAGALFALHPVQVEAVVSIANRDVVLAGALLLAMLVVWRGAAGTPGRSGRVAALVLALLANLAKQTAVVSGLMVAAVEALAGPTTAGRSRRLRALVPHVAVMLAFVWLGLWVGRREGIVQPAPIGPAARVRLALAAVGWYARTLVWPARLLPAYDVDPPAGWLDGGVVTGVAVLAGAVGVVATCRRRAPRVALGVLLAGVALAPVAHGLGTQVVADRYAYVPMAGVALAVAAALERPAARAPRVVGLACVLALLLLAGAARARVGVWRDDVTLFGDAVATEPGKPLWHHLLGRALVGAGDAAAGRAEMARAQALAPGGTVGGYCPIPVVVATLARAREAAGDLGAAERMLRTTLDEARPGEVDAAAVDLAGFYLRRGDRGRARDAYLEAVARDPDAAPRAVEALRQLDREAARAATP
jgi:hypothetical protein